MYLINLLQNLSRFFEEIDCIEIWCFHRLHWFNLLNNSQYIINQLSLTFFLIEYDIRSIAHMGLFPYIYREKNYFFFSLISQEV